MLKEMHVWLADAFVRLEGQKAYDEANQYFDSVIAKLTKEVKLFMLAGRPLLLMSKEMMSSLMAAEKCIV